MQLHMVLKDGDGQIILYNFLQFIIGRVQVYISNISIIRIILYSTNGKLSLEGSIYFTVSQNSKSPR